MGHVELTYTSTKRDFLSLASSALGGGAPYNYPKIYFNHNLECEPNFFMDRKLMVY